MARDEGSSLLSPTCAAQAHNFDELSSARVRGTQEDVLLVNMPYAFLFRPSLALSLLKALLLERGVSARILYATFQFAELAGADLYFRLANETPDSLTLAGEWPFAPALLEPTEVRVEVYLATLLRANNPGRS